MKEEKRACLIVEAAGRDLVQRPESRTAPAAGIKVETVKKERRKTVEDIA